MSGKSKIEWTDATWNPVDGCTPVSAGCDHCWALRMSRRTFGRRPFSEVQCHPDRLNQPLHWRKPRKIAVCLMGDLFHQAIGDRFIAEIFQEMWLSSRHTFQVLTKRPARMLAFLSRAKSWEGWMTIDGKPIKGYGGNAPILGTSGKWPIPNVWLGVSVEDQKTADERIPLLLQTPAAVRFVSYEPALGPVDLERGGFSLLRPVKSPANQQWPGLDWLIAGGESGPGARPSHPAWFRSVRDQCQADGVPFFFKQYGEWAPYYYASSVERPLLKVSVPIWGKSPGFEKAKEVIVQDPGKGMAGDINMIRLGKKRAGRLLDGREWNQSPEVK